VLLLDLAFKQLFPDPKNGTFKGCDGERTSMVRVADDTTGTERID
jgi:hypothetical protein